MKLIDANELTPDTEWDDYEDGYISYSQMQIDNASTVRAVVIPENITRKELHKLIFGINPPELDSPYYDCANRKGGCDNCKHRDDERCNKNWWESLYEGSDTE